MVLVACLLSMCVCTAINVQVLEADDGWDANNMIIPAYS